MEIRFKNVKKEDVICYIIMLLTYQSDARLPLENVSYHNRARSLHKSYTAAYFFPEE